MKQYLTTSSIRFIDHSKQQKILDEWNRAFISFAIDDAIATTVGDGFALPTVRTWVHPPTLVLGIPDSRLPFIEDGIKFMKEHHYQVLIRNSGGLAVLLDEGVLNMSLIIPGNRELSIHDSYNMMYEFIQHLFQDYTTDIKAYEIVGSYCPGDYDLSINGIKFAGISQRRIRNGIAVQIYLDISGNSSTRASLVRDFYTISKKNKHTKYIYPTVRPEVMGTISKLTNQPFTVDSINASIKKLLSKYFTLREESLTEKEAAIFKQRLLQMEKRNERLPS